MPAHKRRREEPIKWIPASGTLSDLVIGIIIGLHLAGADNSAIADMVRSNVSTVRRVVKDVDEDGRPLRAQCVRDSMTLSRSSEPSSSESPSSKVERVARRRQAIADLISEEPEISSNDISSRIYPLGFDVTGQTVRNDLEAMGMRYKKAVKTS